MRCTFIVEGGRTEIREFSPHQYWGFHETVLELLDHQSGSVLVIRDEPGRSMINRYSVICQDLDTFSIRCEAVNFDREPFSLVFHRNLPYTVYTPLRPFAVHTPFILPVFLLGEGLDEFGKQVAVKTAHGDVLMVSQEDLQ